MLFFFVAVFAWQVSASLARRAAKPYPARQPDFFMFTLVFCVYMGGTTTPPHIDEFRRIY